MGRSEKLAFGTDGVRGEANAGWLRPGMVTRLGLAAGSLLREKAGNPERPTIMIGRDSRPSGPMLENALAAGLQSAGIEVIRLGLIPTPAVAALVREERLLGGAMVSASHNPAADNGIKFFGGDGYKLDDELERAIPERFHDEALLESLRFAPERVGGEREFEDPLARYLTLAGEAFPAGQTLHAAKLVIDAANGAASEAAPALFRELGADVIALGCDAKSGRINEGCGSTHPEMLARAVVEHRASLGIAFDGDADRVLFVDETGSVLDGDELLAIAGVAMLEKGELTDGLLVATVMSNLALDHLLESNGGRVLRTAVGDRHVIQAMREHQGSFGGEQSGHLIFHQYSTTGDGLVSALRLLAMIEERGQPLSQLRRLLEKYPQAQRNIRVTEKLPLEQVAGLKEAQERIEHSFGERGRVLIRYSGTEAKVRILVEGPEREATEAAADRLADCFKP